eukprot:SAG31_NODE_160_length_21908_cov_25.529048_11_plen_50_part_00
MVEKLGVLRLWAFLIFSIVDDIWSYTHLNKHVGCMVGGLVVVVVVTPMT